MTERDRQTQTDTDRQKHTDTERDRQTDRNEEHKNRQTLALAIDTESIRFQGGREKNVWSPLGIPSL